MAFKQDVLGAVVRIFTDAVFASYRSRAQREGIEGCEGGAVTFLQRFGGSLNLNLHLHVALLDGVFTHAAEKRVQFHPARAVDAAELQVIAQRVDKRVTAWLRRHGYLTDEPRSSYPLPGEGADDWDRVRAFFVAAAGALITPPTSSLEIQRRIVDVHREPSTRKATKKKRVRRA